MEKGSNERKGKRTRVIKGKVMWKLQVPRCDTAAGRGSHRDCPLLSKSCAWPAAHPCLNSWQVTFLTVCPF